MGSKTKTYTNFNAARMFEDKDNLYAQEMVRIFAQTKTIDPMVMLKSMINDSMQFFNEGVFTKMGKVIDIDFNQGILTKEAVLNEVKKIDSNATVVNEFFTKDEAGVYVNSKILKTKDALDDTLHSSDSCGGTIGYQDFTYQGNTLRCELQYPDYNIDEDLYRVVMNNGIPESGDTGAVYSASMQKLEDCNLVSTYEDALLFEQNNRSVIAVVYNGNKMMYLYEDTVIREIHDYAGFALVLRKDFQNTDPEDSKENKFMYARFGLNAENEDGKTLYDELDQPDLKDAFLTYASNREDNLFGTYIDMLYNMPEISSDPTIPGLEKPGNKITITGEINIVYSTQSDFGETASYNIEYGGGSFPADYQDEDTGEWENRYIIPFGIINDLKLKDRFEAYNKLFTMFAYSEKTVKIKWYQTTFFRFLFMIVGLAFALMTGVPIINILIGMAANMLMQFIDPELAMILGIVIGLMTGSISFDMNILQLANNILKVIQTFHVMAFQDSMEAIKDNIKALQEETEEMREELNETLHDTILIPFGDKVEYLYNGLYNAAYDVPDMVAYSVDMDRYTNYDKYYRS